MCRRRPSAGKWPRPQGRVRSHGHQVGDHRRTPTAAAATPHSPPHCHTTAAGRQRCVAHVPLTCGYAAPLPAPSLCSRPRYPASPVPSGAPCHLVARATPRSAQNRGRTFLCSDPKRLSRFGHHEASCAPRRARIPTQRPVFGLETPPRYQRQAKKPDHVSWVHRCTVPVAFHKNTP